MAMNTSAWRDPRYQEAARHVQDGAWKAALEKLHELQQEYPEQVEIQYLIDSAQIKVGLDQKPVSGLSPLMVAILHRRRLTILAVILLVMLVLAGGWLGYQRWVEPARLLRRHQMTLVQTLSQAHRQLGQAAYADAYVAYWAMQAPAASAVSFGVRADWNSAHGSLSRLNAIDVYNALRAAAEAAQQALSGVPAWASEQARKRAADASLLASDARARLATDGLVQRCEQGVREWVSLGGDPEKARQAVLALEPDALTTRFLVGGKDAGYWGGVWMAALRTLAESGQSESRAAVDLLRASRGIPLCRDSDRTLDAGRVADAFRAANDVRAAIAGSPADRSGARTLAEGARTNLPDIDREIERMRGGVVLPGQRGQAWFQGLCAILDALHAHDDPLSFQVIALPADQHPDGLPPFEAFGLFEAGIRKTNPDGRSRFRLVPGAPTDTVGGIVVPGGEIEVRFYDNEADGAPAVASAIIPAPWTMLGAIASWGGQPLHGEGLDGAWGVIILARRTGDPDSRIPVRIGLRPNRSLPHPAQWPSESSWPE